MSLNTAALGASTLIVLTAFGDGSGLVTGHADEIPRAPHPVWLAGCAEAGPATVGIYALMTVCPDKGR